MSAPVISAKAILGAVSVEIEHGRPPFTVTVGRKSSVKHSRSYAFMDMVPGTYAVQAIDADGLASQVEVLVP